MIWSFRIYLTRSLKERSPNFSKSGILGITDLYELILKNSFCENINFVMFLEKFCEYCTMLYKFFVFLKLYKYIQLLLVVNVCFLSLKRIFAINIHEAHLADNMYTYSSIKWEKEYFIEPNYLQLWCKVILLNAESYTYVIVKLKNKP